MARSTSPQFDTARRLPWLLAGCLLVGPAAAGDWKLTDRFSSSLVLSDNIDRDGNGDSGLILNVRPTLNLLGSGARVNGALVVSPSLSQEVGGGSDTDAVLFMNGNARAELYRNVFFVDARASAGLISASGRSNVGLDGIGGLGGDATRTYTMAIGPELRGRLGKYADVRARLDLNRVQNDGAGVNSSNGATASLTFSSGRYFTQLPWSVTASHSEVRYDARDDSRTRLNGRVFRRFDRQWNLHADLGVERNDVATLRNDTDGLTWSLGGAWTPNPRTSLDFDYGQRYFGNYWRVDLAHRSRRTTLTGGFSREVTSSRAEQLDSLFNPGSGTLPSLDPNTNLPALLDEDYVNTRLRLGLVVTGLRTTVSTNVALSQRDFENSDRSEDTFDFGVRASRRLADRLTANTAFNWQRIESQNQGDTDTYQISVGASKALGRRSSVGVSVSHRQQDGRASTNSTENRVTATFSTSFL